MRGRRFPASGIRPHIQKTQQEPTNGDDMKLKNLLGMAAIGLAASLGTGAAHAAYPEKPVQYIIPFTPGGESDYVARVQSEIFKNKFKQSMIVLNKPGAGGGLVWAQLNSMPADG